MFHRPRMIIALCHFGLATANTHNGGLTRLCRARRRTSPARYAGAADMTEPDPASRTRHGRSSHRRRRRALMPLVAAAVAPPTRGRRTRLVDRGMSEPSRWSGVPPAPAGSHRTRRSTRAHEPPPPPAGPSRRPVPDGVARETDASAGMVEAEGMSGRRGVQGARIPAEAW
jgi:hypothetical protein